MKIFILNSYLNIVSKKIKINAIFKNNNLNINKNDFGILICSNVAKLEIYIRISYKIYCW